MAEYMLGIIDKLRLEEARKMAPVSQDEYIFSSYRIYLLMLRAHFVRAIIHCES